MREYFKSDIVRLSKPVESIKDYCVYFLINDNDIVYVGFTSDLQYRLKSHKTNKIFDRYHFIKVVDVIIGLELEKSYIKKFKPAYNIAHNEENMQIFKTKRNQLCKIESISREEIKEKIKQENFKLKPQSKDYIFPETFETPELIDVKFNLIKNTFCKKIINGISVFIINHNGSFYKVPYSKTVNIVLYQKEYHLTGIYGELK